jgi:glycosyltransferase involved in cell wall biosynthesis
MDISIIVPVFNSASYVSHCLEALESQDYPRDRYEIIAVDNNSTDGSDSIVMGYPSVKLLREAKQGSYAARSRGLREAVGAVVAFTDSDCAPDGGWLASIMAGMNQPGAGVVMGRTLPANQSRCLGMFEAYQHHYREYIYNSGRPDFYFGYTNNMAVRRELLDPEAPFVERSRGADTILVHQLASRLSCDIVRYCPEMRVRHLEIAHMPRLYQKTFIYAREARLYRHIAHVRRPESMKWLGIYGRTCRASGLSPFQSVMLLALLALALASSQMGRLSAMARPA